MRPFRSLPRSALRRLALGAALSGLAAASTSAAAQELDLVGSWTCTHAEYDSGADLSRPVESVFNLALYRSGEWASAGRRADGAPYQGEGTWRYGRAAGAGLTVRLEGRIKAGIALPEPFGFEADIAGPDEFGRISQRYRTTTAVECVRREP